MGTPLANQTVSGYNSAPPADDGTVSAANKVKWATIKTQLSDPLNSFDSALNTALRTALNVTPTSQSSAYTTTTADHLRPIEVTGTTTISLGDAATMVAAAMGYQVPIMNTGTAVVTVALITAANTLAGKANGTVTLNPGQGMMFAVNSTSNGYDITATAGFYPFILTGAAGTNTVTANAPSNLTALFDGLIVVLVPAGTNTGATTLNITPSGGAALTAKNIFAGNSALVGGELHASIPVLLRYDGTQFQVLGPVFKQPTRTVLTTGTAATYTTPTGATRINVRIIGAGGGGAGSGTTPGAATAGTATTFGTLTANAGAQGIAAAAGAGGSATGGDWNITGQDGTDGIQANSSTSDRFAGGNGGSTLLGGGGTGQQNAAGRAAYANTGGGGAGGGIFTANLSCGGGGGAGGYCEKLITAPAATYTYTVGAKGTGGTAGTSGFAGGDGAAGLIIIDEWYA